MKTISATRTYIDYTWGNSGVRVWKDHCQAIARDNELSEWDGRESVYPVPVPDSILGLPHSGTPPTSKLAFEVAQYDDKARDPELRGVLKGWMPFEQAIAI